jgi:hypothetical protein
MVTKSDTYLICITKNAYDLIIGEHQRRLKKEKLDYLRKIPLFKGLKESTLSFLILNLRND